MIKANELRIGNKVDYYGNIVTINYINDTDVGFSDYVPFDYPLLDEINPVPITEDRLVRFGFKRDTKYDWELKVNGVIFYGMVDNRQYDYLNSIFILNLPDSKINIHHIHQLQNLYYALTGEEMKYD
jgi:hypothetical protein